MNIPDAPPSPKTIKTALPSRKQGLQLIVLIALLLLIATAFESLRFFYPVTLQAAQPLQPQQLPDGTAVTLDAGSRVTLGNEWTRKSLRELWLQGGAWFSVPLQADTSRLTIHLSHFDVLVQNATLYCSNQKGDGYAWLKEGNATILTHESKQKTYLFKSSTIIKWTGHQLSIEPAPDPIPAE